MNREWKLRQRRERRLSLKTGFALFVGIPAGFIGFFYAISIWPYALLLAFPVAILVGLICAIILDGLGAPLRATRPEQMPDEMPLPEGVARFPDREPDY